MLTTVREADSKIPMVSVLLSGRPMLIDDVANVSDSVIAAWLPGTSGGQGIVDAITGEYVLRKGGSKANTLSVDWPRNMVRHNLS